jgi:succinate dehydrogenase / fumarate reductase cytochrome b subunit
MNRVVKVVWSSLGKKYLMALTGAGLFLFACVHMVGNLQIFLGQEAINHYGDFLKSNPEVIWPARLGLLALVLIHIGTAIALTLENRATRDQPYARKEIVAASTASRTMLVSGSVVFAYLVYHLLHFTLGVTNPGYMEYHDAEGRHDVYRMMIEGFSNGWVSSFYIVGVGLLCFHLSHGVSAMLQSLGLKNHVYDVAIERFALLAAIILFVGYAAVPTSVLLGWVK